MDSQQVEAEVLSKVIESIISLPYDTKVLQEVVADPELELKAREKAASVLIHILGEKAVCSIESCIEDSLYLKMSLFEVIGMEGAEVFQERFAEFLDTLQQDLPLLKLHLGDTLWEWLEQKLAGFIKVPFKGKKAAQYVEDEQGLMDLYEEILEFQTDYPITEAQVTNKLRRSEQIKEILEKHRAEDLKKIKLRG